MCNDVQQKVESVDSFAQRGNDAPHRLHMLAMIAVVHFQQEHLLVPVFGHDLACQDVPSLSDSSFEISKLHLPLPESCL